MGASMSYAELAGMPPEYGFSAVIPALLVYAVAGTSRHLGVGRVLSEGAEEEGRHAENHGRKATHGFGVLVTTFPPGRGPAHRRPRAVAAQGRPRRVVPGGPGEARAPREPGNRSAHFREAAANVLEAHAHDQLRARGHVLRPRVDELRHPLPRGRIRQSPDAAARGFRAACRMNLESPPRRRSG